MELQTCRLDVADFIATVTLDRAPPLVGEHTDEVLRELGLMTVNSD
jgi:crotonobetainyl-CoA:carnitine CoA-transferase CaiB-like acyl-CoA transferase